MTGPDLSRMAQRAAFEAADYDTERAAEPLPTMFLATVSGVAAGAAADGNALVSVTWRGQPVETQGYAASYTPQVGDRVRVDVVADQIFIAYAVAGYSNPPTEDVP